MASGPPVFPRDQAGIPSFAQQGQVDWVAFGNTAWNMTSATLQRFSAAEIQPATYGAALAFGCRFNLGSIGRRRVGDALQKLQGSPAFRKVLWFGFGYRSFVHILSDSQAGFNCMALCACLADTHGRDIAASVLSEIWRVCEFPDEYEPSHAQFANLVRVCEGMLAYTSFGVTVDKMVDLSGISASQQRNNHQNPYFMDREICAKAKDIAEVLCALFDISKGKVETITIAGATECAFIGAVAQWLFDLNVYIEGATANTHSQHKPHVIVRYDLQDNSVPETSIARLQSVTYFLNNVDNAWSQISSTDAADSSLILRVPWESALSRTFGLQFDQLCKVSYALAEFLGTAARIYSAFAHGEEELGPLDKYRDAFIDYVDTCYGSGLVHAIPSIFPELAKVNDLTTLMQLPEGMSFAQAVKSFQESVSSIMLHCTCHRCGHRGMRETPKTCLLSIAYAILSISRMLGAVIRHPELLPTISGIRHFHQQAPREREPSELVSSLLVCGQDQNTLFLQNPLILFSGSPPGRDTGPTGLRGSASIPTAISYRGICCYSSGLRHLTSQPEEIRIIHALPGHIQRGSRLYDVVYDHPEPEDIEYQIERMHDFNRFDPKSVIGKVRSDLKVLVTEQPGAKALYFSYSVMLNPNQMFEKGRLPALSIPPGSLALDIMMRSCLIPCSSDLNCQDDEIFPRQQCPQRRVPLNWQGSDQLTVLSAGDLIFQNGIACTMSRPEEDDVDLCIAVQLLKLSNSRVCYLLVRRHECLSCSTRAILKYGPEVMRSIKAGKATMPDYDIRVVFHILNTRRAESFGSLALAEHPMNRMLAASHSESCTVR